MSNKLPEQPNNEEVDLVIIFRLLGRAFSKLFRAIGSFFHFIFRLVVFALKPIVENFKLISVVLIGAALVGYFVEKFKDPVYSSSMLVKPYYDSEYQLTTNINYFNSLIGSGNYKELSEIFEIDSLTTAKQLLGFEIQIGPETQYDLIREYDEYMQSIDSTLVIEMTFEDFLEKRDILAGTIFSITANATENDIFPSLEKGFVKTFENEYSKKLKAKTDSIRRVKKQTFLQELKRVQDIQETYLEIKKNESSKGEATYASGTIPLVQEKTKTREYDLFQEELRIRRAIRTIDEELLDKNEYYDILSRFEEVGTIQTSIFNKYTFIFPALIFVLMVLAYTFFRVFKFIKDYE